MRRSPLQDPSIDRLLTFEVASSVYALPITAVLEVAEADRCACVPGLSASVAGVMNWHGDALPLLASRLLLDTAGASPVEARAPEASDSELEGFRVVEADAGPEASVPSRSGAPQGPVPAESQTILRDQVLVVSDRSGETARLGMPVDRVIGLIDGEAQKISRPGVVAERRPVDGRVVSVLDPHRLLMRAEEIIECAVS